MMVAFVVGLSVEMCASAEPEPLVEDETAQTQTETRVESAAPDTDEASTAEVTVFGSTESAQACAIPPPVTTTEPEPCDD